LTSCKLHVGEILHRKFERDLDENEEGDANIPIQINGRARKIWIIDLEYCSDTRYIDKVKEKEQRHAQLCNLLTTYR
jgi:pyruvate carboxylase